MNNHSFKLNYGSSLLVLLIFLLANGLMFLPSLIYPNYLTNENQLNYLLLFQTIPFYLTFICVTYFFNGNSKKLKIKTRFSGFSIFFTSIALFFFTLLLNEFLVGLIPTKGYPVIEKMYKDLSEIFEQLKPMPVTLVLATCIFAPLLEEILFRGILLRGLLNNRNNPYLAIFFTSFLFGLVHGNPWQFMGGLTIGLAMGYIYYKTQSLVYTILIHALNNSIAAYLLFTVEDFEIQEIKGITFLGAMATLLIIIALGSLLHLLTNKSRRKMSI